MYVLTESGQLACLRIQDGTEIWQRNILRDFSGRQIPWLISESPLVDGNHVIVTPGGPRAGIVALDKLSGRTVWTSDQLSDEAGYASPIAGDVQGVRVYMTLTSSAGVGVRASDGKLMWRFQPVANGTANVATPVFAENKVFYTSNYGTGAALLGLTAQNGEVNAQQIYFTREMQNHHGGVVLVNGYLYGFHNTILVCLDFATGKLQWRDRSVGKGSLTYADGNLTSSAKTTSSGSPRRRRRDTRRRGASRSRIRVFRAGRIQWSAVVCSTSGTRRRSRRTMSRQVGQVGSSANSVDRLAD